MCNCFLFRARKKLFKVVSRACKGFYPESVVVVVVVVVVVAVVCVFHSERTLLHSPKVSRLLRKQRAAALFEKSVSLINDDTTLKSFFLLESARETLLFAICKREDERISFETRAVEEEVVQR